MQLEEHDPDGIAWRAARREREIAARDALRELHLMGKFDSEPTPYQLTPADRHLLRSCGIASDGKESRGAVYRDLPDETLEPMRRYATLTTRGAALVAIVEHAQEMRNEQPTARYAHALLREMYHDSLVSSAPYGAADAIENALEELAGKDPDEPVPAELLRTAYLRACPGGARALGFLKRHRGGRV